MRSISIAGKPAESLLASNIALAALILALALAQLIGLLSSVPRIVLLLPLIAMAVPFFALVLLLLTLIEDCGIRFFGRKRGWRVSREVSAAVCAHASIGWVVGSVLTFAVVTMYFQQTWASGTGLVRRLAWLTNDTRWISAASLTLFAGLLVFEILVYIGVRECRYANPPRPGSEPESLTTTAQSPLK